MRACRLAAADTALIIARWLATQAPLPLKTPFRLFKGLRTALPIPAAFPQQPPRCMRSLFRMPDGRPSSHNSGHCPVIVSLRAIPGTDATKTADLLRFSSPEYLRKTRLHRLADGAFPWRVSSTRGYPSRHLVLFNRSSA